MKKCGKKLIVLMLILGMVASMVSGCGKNKKSKTEEQPVIQETESTTEEAAASEEEEYDYTLYRQFLGLEKGKTVEAVVDEGVSLAYADFDYEYVGKSYTLESLTQQMNDLRLRPETVGYDIKVLYDYVDYKGQKTLALRFNNMCTDGDGDSSYSIVYVANRDGELHITYAISSWSRQTVSVTGKGSIYANGSAGAGEQIITSGFIGEGGKYYQIYGAYELTGQWIGSEINLAIYTAAYDYEEEPGIKVYKFVMGQDTMYCYEQLDGKEMSEHDKKFVSLSEEGGLIWRDKGEILTNLATYAVNTLHAEDNIMSDSTPMSYKILADAADGSKMECYYLDYETDSDYWNSQSILGYTTTLDTVLSKQFVDKGAEPLAEENIPTLEMKADEDGYASESKLYFIDERVTKSGKPFQIYITDRYNTVIRTPDGKAVKNYISPIDFIYGTLPQIILADFDEDGEEELGVWEYILHGTGFSQDTLYIVDKGADGEWYSYLLSPKWYVNEIARHYLAVDQGDTIDIYIDTEKVSTVDKNGDTSPLAFLGAYFVDISGSSSSINLVAKPLFYSDQTPTGIYTGQIKLSIKYKGAGEWRTDTYSYKEDMGEWN